MGMVSVRRWAAGLVLATATVACMGQALTKQPASVYHARRVALAGELKGGAAILFAAEEPVLDFMP